MATYSDEDKVNALNLYVKSGSFTRVEKMTGITRASLHAWAKAGVATGGRPWQAYREEIQQRDLQEVRTRELTEVANGERKYLEQVKHDLREIAYEAVIAKFRAGDFDAKIGDLTEIVKLYNMLENGAAEKIAFGRYFVGKVLEILFEIVDEKQFSEFKTRVQGMQAEIEAKLNPLSITHGIPK